MSVSKLGAPNKPGYHFVALDTGEVCVSTEAESGPKKDVMVEADSIWAMLPDGGHRVIERKRIAYWWPVESGPEDPGAPAQLVDGRFYIADGLLWVLRMGCMFPMDSSKFEGPDPSGEIDGPFLNYDDARSELEKRRGPDEP